MYRNFITTLVLSASLAFGLTSCGPSHSTVDAMKAENVGVDNMDQLEQQAHHYAQQLSDAIASEQSEAISQAQQDIYDWFITLSPEAAERVKQIPELKSALQKVGEQNSSTTN